MGLADRGRRRFRQAEEAHLALLHQFGHRPDRLLDRRIGVDAVLIIEVDVIDAEAAQAALDRAAHIGGRAVGHSRAVRLAVDPELGGDESLVATPLQRLAHQDFIGVGAVHLGRVEQGDAQVECAVDHRNGLGLVGAAVKGAHAHAAQTDGRDLRAVTAQLAHLHPRIPSDVRGSAAHPPTLFRWAPYGLISRGRLRSDWPRWTG
ncbi:hypothetical protein D3C85_1269690 [compost metagenome]